MYLHKLIAIAAACSLMACSGSDPAPTPEEQTDRASGTLEKATETTLTQYFRSTLRGGLNQGDTIARDEGGAVESNSGSSADAASPAATGSDGGSNKLTTSGTNLQETGVDEADLIKTDGQYIYAIYNTGNNYYANDAIELTQPGKPGKPDTPENGIRMMQVSDNGAALTEVQKIINNDSAKFYQGLYLTPDTQQLVALNSNSHNAWDNWFYPSYFQNQSIDVEFIDVKDPADALLETTLSFDGTLISSRRVDNTLYLVLRYYPNLSGWHPYPASETDKASNQQRLTEVRSEDLLPTYALNSKPKGIMVQPDTCYINKGVARETADVISLVAIDLSAAQPTFKSNCYIGSTEALYASRNALYLSSTRWNYQYSDTLASSYAPAVTTDVHKFAFKGLDFDYRGSAEVAGHLGYEQDRKSFRFSENAAGDFLRVITYNESGAWITTDGGISVDSPTTGTEVSADAPPPDSSETRPAPVPIVQPGKTSPVMLTILKESLNLKALTIVSQLPNTNRPEPIGKPGEQLYASRYIGDRAYLVTFRATDPLYVLDLSNPADPFIAGELEIDGYSDFLQPVTENLLLGIGKHAIADQSAGPGQGGAWYQGVKLSLIDVTDPQHPTEVDKLIIGKRGTESAALRDHHAVTSLTTENGIYRVALPITLHDTPTQYGGDRSEPFYYYDYSYTGLHRYEIDPLTKKIKPVKTMVVATSKTQQYDYSSDSDRSVMIGDHVHYLHNGKFWSQDWNSEHELSGPE